MPPPASQDDSYEFPPSRSVFGEDGPERHGEGAEQEVEGDCPPLDAWFASDSDSDPPRAITAGEEDAGGDEERQGRDRELREEEEASRLLRSWCVRVCVCFPRLSFRARSGPNMLVFVVSSVFE